MISYKYNDRRLKFWPVWLKLKKKQVSSEELQFMSSLEDFIYITTICHLFEGLKERVQNIFHLEDVYFHKLYIHLLNNSHLILNMA
jgi:hypothetical protein